jgi:DNA-binding HxlR family transcriptional regulator
LPWPNLRITVSYQLTPLGEGLLEVVDQLTIWAYAHIPEIERATAAKGK